MGNYDRSASEAWQSLRDNPAARWSSGLDGDAEPGTAWQRITAGSFFEPQVKADFSIGREDRIFAIGSCFARNVEVALRALGHAVESVTGAFDEFTVAAPMTRPIGFTNKYNTESIYNELSWALEPGKEFSAEALLQLADGSWEDPHVSPVFARGDLDLTLRRHRMLSDVTARIADCRVVVITLGLIETFFDEATDLYTNATPRLDAGQGRFRFRVLSFEQVVAALERIHTLLSERGHPDVQIVVTVSPVPLEATFTGEDVVVANMLSKSLLRAAAGAWAGSHENVHYFPSYEIVMNSHREGAWERDGRHVRHELVQHIMELFVRAHVVTDGES